MLLNLLSNASRNNQYWKEICIAGDTVVPMVSGFVELALRIGTALLLPTVIGYWGVYLAEIAAWIGAGIFLIIGCYRRLKMTG